MSKRIFKVGGCVRDTLLGREPKDIDYVVIGATPEEMLAEGYVQVGADFPVFLKDGCEYALARKERKVAAGYHGFETQFDISVTLEADLERRDLTLNAMAQDAETGEIIDPFNGRQDLEARVLRHVSPAFAEDPLRVLRVARFAARYEDFTIADETIELLKEIVKKGELAYLSNERIVVEFEKAFSEANPARFVAIMHQVGALQAVVPELAQRISEVTSERLSQWFLVISKLTSVRDRLAFLFRQVEGEKAIAALDRLRFPVEVKELIIDYVQFEHFYDLSAERTVQVFDHFKVTHSAHRFWRAFYSYNVATAHNKRDPARAQGLLTDYFSVDFQSLPNRAELKGKAITAAIKAARIAKIEKWF